MSEMSPYELSSSELLMLANHCPKSPVELHLLIEESEDRLNEVQVEQILTVVRRVLRNEEEEEEVEMHETNDQDNAADTNDQNGGEEEGNANA
jgi:hypothetical protein